MATVWTDGNGNFHEGDQQSGDRLATDAETAAWEASKVTLDTVQAECQRRLDLVVTLNQKLHMSGALISVLAGVVLNAQTATPTQISNAALYGQAMQWVAAMNAVVPTLVGNVDYADNSNWPVPSSALVAFVAQY